MKKLLAVFVMGLSASAFAEGSDTHFYAGVGLDAGGDEVAKVKLSDGSSEAIDAGAGVSFTLGADIDLSEDTMLRATLGYKFDNVSAENGDMTFSRVPLEVLGYRFWGEHGIGGGLGYHTAVKFDCDFSGVCNDSVDLDDELGLIVEYLYRSRREDSNKGFSIGVRAGLGYEYQADGGGGSVDGNYLGVNLGITL